VYRFAAGCITLILVMAAPGCNQKPAPVAMIPVAVEPVSLEPCEVELSEAMATFAEPNIVRFEVKYRFTKGKPDKFYSCNISFPGSKDGGTKAMQSWQLKAEGGVIKDGVALTQPRTQTFEIYMAEAPTGQDPFKKISNVVSGPVK
jgi:hypothetical protein